VRGARPLLPFVQNSRYLDRRFLAKNRGLLRALRLPSLTRIMWPPTRPCFMCGRRRLLLVAADAALLRGQPRRPTSSKTDRRFSGFPSQARKDQKISPVLLSVCTPRSRAKAKVASQMQPNNKKERKRTGAAFFPRLSELTLHYRLSKGFLAAVVSMLRGMCHAFQRLGFCEGPR
jgi:hypothetical protein